MRSSTGLPDLADEAESMRREGRLHEALEVVERFLRKNPNHQRAVLLRSRVLYELGRMAQAVEELHALQRTVGGELQSIVDSIERLANNVQSMSAPAFATESMAGLLAQQGYFLEALEVYRELSEAAPEKSDLCDEIVRLKTIVEREGSRGATRERVARELEACDFWLSHRQRGS